VERVTPVKSATRWQRSLAHVQWLYRAHGLLTSSHVVEIPAALRPSAITKLPFTMANAQRLATMLGPFLKTPYEPSFLDAMDHANERRSYVTRVVDMVVCMLLDEARAAPCSSYEWMRVMIAAFPDRPWPLQPAGGYDWVDVLCDIGAWFHSGRLALLYLQETEQSASVDMANRSPMSTCTYVSTTTLLESPTQATQDGARVHRRLMMPSSTRCGDDDALLGPYFDN